MSAILSLSELQLETFLCIVDLQNHKNISLSNINNVIPLQGVSFVPTDVRVWVLKILAAIMQPSFILHSDIYRGGLQFCRISTVAQKYFDSLPCFSLDIYATLSSCCRYTLFNPNVPCFSVILTISMQNITFYLFRDLRFC